MRYFGRRTPALRRSAIHGFYEGGFLGSINCSGVLIAFFIEDLGAVSLAGGDVSLVDSEALALLRAGVLEGEYYETTNEDHELIGYTMWMPPGRDV